MHPVCRPQAFINTAKRIYEKIHEKVVTTAEDAGGLKAAIFRWAIGVGRRACLRRDRGVAQSRVSCGCARRV